MKLESKERLYLKTLNKEAKSFDSQVQKRQKKGFIPDLRSLKKNYYFYNNPWREPQIYQIQWMPVIKKIISRCKKNKGKVLEVGCGTGFLSLEIARNGLDVTGIDISNESISIANKEKNKNKIEGFLNYICGDSTTFSFKEKFNTIIFFRSYHHFPNRKKLLKNLEKNIKKGITEIIMCEPIRSNFTDLNSSFALLLRLSLNTWEGYDKKIPKNISQIFIKKKLEENINEYKYENKKNKVQSPFDNSVNSDKQIFNDFKSNFIIKELKYHDAFIDKLIGGLRGKSRFLIAQMLKEFDNYLIETGILKGTTIFTIFKSKKKH